ncbi:MAG: hypothetical protein QOC69_5475 [Mycobacterium sp.]|jgi:hypothetical protein|nr:hypothetical protein [Mycobacterium sp.]
MSAATTSAVLGRRACALVAVCSAAVHGLMLGQAGNPAVATLVVAMMGACLYCARDLWTASSPRAWCVVAVMNLGMVAVHWSAPGHHHGGAVNTAVALPTSTLMTVATALSVLEAAAATAVLYVQSRGRTVSVG